MPATPIIFENGNAFNPTAPANQSKLRKWLPRILYVVLGAIILTQVYWGYKTLTAPVPGSNVVTPLSGGKLYLISSQTDYKTGDTIPVTIRVNTGGWTTDGTDILLKYNKDILEIEGNSPTAFKRGSIYQEYPVINIDSQAGTVQISGIATATSEKKGFNGIDVFGILNFKAKQSGNAKIEIEFQKDNTEDSNIIETSSSRDILEEVTNLELKIN